MQCLKQHFFFFLQLLSLKSVVVSALFKIADDRSCSPDACLVLL